MADHPSRDELSAFLRGDLSAESRRMLVRHLLGQCGDCISEMMELSRGGSSSEYDAAIDRAWRSVNEKGQEKGRTRRRPPRKKKDEIAGIEELLARSWSLRYEDPSEMVRYAMLAAKCAERLDVRRHGRERVLDLRGRTLAELGNSYRVLDQLDVAEEKLEEAGRILELGTRDESLRMRLLDLEASLAADRRRFSLAAAFLLEVAEYHRACGDRHLTGRALIQQGLYVGYAGQPREALQVLEQGLALVDKEQEPELVYAGLHNQLLFIIDCGRFAEARTFRLRHSNVLSRDHGRVNRARLQELGGRIEAGLGRPDRAEAIFREAKRDFEELERPYLASIVRLDLAAALLALSRPDDAAEVVMEAHRVFVALRISREALMAVLILFHAIRMGEATAEMAQKVAAFLRRLERDPNAKFDPDSL